LFVVINEVISMQRFVAELSTGIYKVEFERSWRSDGPLHDKRPEVEFTFDGRRVSAVVDSDSSDRWPRPAFTGALAQLFAASTVLAIFAGFEVRYSPKRQDHL
jgi:hypothetical protein